MKITEIAFSCYAVTDVPRARAFYEDVLGLTMTEETDQGEHGHWVEYNIGPGTLSIGRSPGSNPTADGCTVGLEVEDFEAAIEKVKATNTPIKMGPFETPVCHMCMISDPDGNTIIIHHRKPGHS